ncbi:hypothetical protein LCGC14_3075190, partial [marine sediment metagenome]
MIKNPYKARFIVPVALSKFSTTAEPTLEGLAGTDYLGNAVADTGQAINVMDGYPNRHLTVTTNHAASPVGTDAWYIAATLNKRENFDCVMLDRVNLLQCYQAALSGSRLVVTRVFLCFESLIEAVPIVALTEGSAEGNRATRCEPLQS